MGNGTNSYKRYCEGDDSGLVEIIKEYKDGLILYLNGFVNNVMVAEELTEDTFVFLGIKKPKDKGISSFKTWLYTIARNIAIDYLRKNSKKKENSMDKYKEFAGEDNELETLVICDERRIAVHRVLKKLKPDYRQVLLLSYFEELSNKEISLIMKKSVHSVENLLYRARRELKEEFRRENLNYEDL